MGFFDKFKKKKKQEDDDEELRQSEAAEQEQAQPSDSDIPDETGEDAAQQAPEAEAAPEEPIAEPELTPEPEEIPQAEEAQPENDEPEEQEEAPKKMGFFEKLKNGLKKTKDGFMSKLELLMNSFTKIDEDFFEEL